MTKEFLRGTNGFAFDFSKEAEYLNREEEIKGQAIKEFPRFAERRVGFITGAKWVDEHPRKGLVDIEKVCKWLEDRIKHDSIDYPIASMYLIKDLREAMMD